jgi:hypothetical protein
MPIAGCKFGVAVINGAAIVTTSVNMNQRELRFSVAISLRSFSLMSTLSFVTVVIALWSLPQLEQGFRSHPLAVFHRPCTDIVFRPHHRHYYYYYCRRWWSCNYYKGNKPTLQIITLYVSHFSAAREQSNKVDCSVILPCNNILTIKPHDNFSACT